MNTEIPDDSVSVNQVRLDQYKVAVTAVLEEYHEWVAAEFRRWLSRLATEDDAGTEAYAAEFSPEAYVDGELRKDISYLEDFEAQTPLWVALDGDDVVGCVYLYRLSEDSGEVKRLYVQDDYRGRGLGRTLMEALIRSAVEDGYSLLRLDTGPFMQSAASLYRDLGFEPYDGQESISDIPTPVLDEITYLRKPLSSGR